MADTHYATTSYASVFDAWCHFTGDSYFPSNSYPAFDCPDTILYGLANPSSADTWRTMITVPMWAPNSTNSNVIEQLSCVAAGAFPTFGSCFYSRTTPGTVTLTATESALTIDGQTFNKSYFRDKVIPKFIAFALQGPGGGGGGTVSADDGTGGGAGGFIAGVIAMKSSITIKITQGGEGGHYSSSSNSEAHGGVTEDSNIDNRIFAGRGNSGHASTKNDDWNAGGAGGTTSVTPGYTGASLVYSEYGGAGGCVYSVKNATGCDSLTAKTTKATNYATLGAGSGLPLYKTWPATSGGAQGDNNAPGGGGGSMLANGPAGGGYTSNGRDGTLGAGGSGARYTLFTYKTGGKGGDGAVYLYY